jgi:hypothetical protein
MVVAIGEEILGMASVHILNSQNEYTLIYFFDGPKARTGRIVDGNVNPSKND